MLNPIDELKATIADFSDNELAAYVQDLNEKRRIGPAKVARSSRTGAPVGGAARDPSNKIRKILDSLPDEEREALLAELQDNDDES